MGTVLNSHNVATQCWRPASIIMATEDRLALRLREIAKRRVARTRGPSQIELRSARAQLVGSQTSSSSTDAAPFKLPAAYSNTSVSRTISPDQPNSPTSPLRQKLRQNEHRRSNRKAVKLSGIIKNDESSLDVDVLVKDMSMHGICLVVDRNNPDRLLPSHNPYISESFQLRIPFDKLIVQCKLIWRDGDTFGAAFNSTPQFQR